MKTQISIDELVDVDYDTLCMMKKQLLEQHPLGSKIRIVKAPHSGMIVAQKLNAPKAPLQVWNEKTCVWM